MKNLFVLIDTNTGKYLNHGRMGAVPELYDAELAKSLKTWGKKYHGNLVIVSCELRIDLAHLTLYGPHKRANFFIRFFRSRYMRVVNFLERKEIV